MMHVRAPDVYVDVMIKRKIHPRAWCMVETYQFYRADFKKVVTDDRWLTISISTIRDVCAKMNAPTCKFYDVIPPHYLVHLLDNLHIHPRLVYCDPRFAAYFESQPDVIKHTIAPRFGLEDFSPADCDEVITKLIDHLSTEQ